MIGKIIPTVRRRIERMQVMQMQVKIIINKIYIWKKKLTKRADADATMAIRAKPMKRDFIFELYFKARLMLIGRCRY